MNIALIFAGGVGKRMGADIPKQFIEVEGKPIIIHTIELFENNDSIDEIFLVIVDGYIEHMEELIKKFKLKKIKNICKSGATALDSIFNGLVEIEKVHKNDNPIVLIHDGVRPFVDISVIDKNIDSVKKHGSAITSIPAFETTLISKDGHTVDSVSTRSETFVGQAPQSFYLNDIIDAHRIVRKKDSNYTNIVDCSNLMNSIGKKTYLVEGNRGNIKITTSEDLYTLKGFLLFNDKKI